MESHRLSEKHWPRVAVHFVLDFLLFILVFLVAMRARFGDEWYAAPFIMWPGLVFGGGVFASAIYIFGFYSPQHVFPSRRRQALVLLLCHGLALAFMVGLFYVNFSTRIGRGIMAIAAPAIYAATLLHHLAFRAWRPAQRERVALIVATPEDEAEAGLFSGLRVHYLKLVGVIAHGDFRPASRSVEVLGTTGELADVCRRHQLNRVLCTNTTSMDRELYRRFCHLRYSGIHVMSLLSLCEEYFQCVPTELVTPEWLMGASGAPHMLYVRKLKRGFDIVVSLLGLVFLWPFLIVGMAAVRLTSTGPVFYRQTRGGRFGRLFQVLKLRTMRVDAEANGAVWAADKDPRLTPVGGLLRKYRIDEIPQLWNVLKGEMSFVGPRPERPEFIEDLASAIPFYHERLLVQPGLTGWAQVSYPYGASVEDARRKLEYDLYYMKHMSLLLDLFILLDTVRIILIGGIGATHKRQKVDYSKALAETRRILAAQRSPATGASEKKTSVCSSS